MNNKKGTTEQMLSIERWENEGGRVSISHAGIEADHLDSTRAKKLDHPELVIQWTRREDARLSGTWSFA